MFKVMAKTERTEWVLIEEVETMEQARTIARKIVAEDSYVQVCIEEDV